MDKLLDSGKYSDLRITCQGRTWNVHRSVVCTRSPIFEAMMDGEFKEAHSGIIDLPDDKPDIVEMMLRFLYQGNYDDTRYSTTPGEELVELNTNALLVDVQVYVIADKNDIPELKVLAQNKYTEIVGQLWQTERFKDSMETVFGETPPGDSLRRVVIKAAATHVRTLIEKDWFVAMLEGQGELAVEVLKEMLALNGDTWTASSGGAINNPIKKRNKFSW